MTGEGLTWLIAVIAIVALLYSSVGHAGASGYIAVLTLAGLAPAEIRPVALVLNIIVASIGTWQFWRAGHFSWGLFWPFALLATPMAYLGGWLALPADYLKIAIGVVLLLSSANLILRPAEKREGRPPRRAVALASGGVLGLFAGLTGTGGGIFLTPLLILTGWARTKQAAGVSVPFILVNSAAGLAGNLSATRSLPDFIWPLVAAVIIGGGVGAWLGSNRLPHQAIKRLLALVLLIAGLKLIFG
ncbi:sulfite exporter TauE/SafE family protein [Sphingomonas sp. FW199]|uniref:sulfite exporter TauE/SafE family protein n=1 Tax=Sphingomonas sp. FW199 TaxID=3400217 RepID=UPI003CF3394B